MADTESVLITEFETERAEHEAAAVLMVGVRAEEIDDLAVRPHRALGVVSLRAHCDGDCHAAVVSSAAWQKALAAAEEAARQQSNAGGEPS